jgi:hypothetical protein
MALQKQGCFGVKLCFEQKKIKRLFLVPLFWIKKNRPLWDGFSA